MFRPITALLLFLLMGVATVTAQPGLKWCLYLETFSVGACDCEMTESPCETCCSDDGCPLSEATSASKKPCLADLQISLGDFVTGQLPDFSKKPFPANSIALPSSEPALPGGIFRSDLVRSIRGSPPLLSGATALPLYLRHSVFLV